ncbi:hypothetical protein GGI15_004079, partial [Coemansia interrupta]
SEDKSKDKPKDESEDEPRDKPKDKSKVKSKDKLKDKSKDEPNNELKVKWGQVLDIEHGSFKKPKNPKPDYCVLKGSVKTDGLVISIIFKNKNTKSRHQPKESTMDAGTAKDAGAAMEVDDSNGNSGNGSGKEGSCGIHKGKCCKGKTKEFSIDCEYIDELSSKTLKENKGKCLLLDPGHSNIFHGVHENSRPGKPMRFQYTRKQRRKEYHIGHFAKICEKAKQSYVDGIIKFYESYLATFSCSTLDLVKYVEYVHAGMDVWQPMDHFYNEMTTGHSSSSHQIHKHYNKCKQFRGKMPQDHLLHRKLRLSAYWNKKQANACLARTLQKYYD